MSKEEIYIFFQKQIRNNLLFSIILLLLILPKVSNENNLTELTEGNNLNISEIFILIGWGNSRFLYETFNPVPTKVLLNGEEFDY